MNSLPNYERRQYKEKQSKSRKYQLLTKKNTIGQAKPPEEANSSVMRNLFDNFQCLMTISERDKSSRIKKNSKEAMAGQEEN